MTKRLPKWLLPLAVAALALVIGGCAQPVSFDAQLREIVADSRFDAAGWEFRALGHEAGQLAAGLISNGAADEIATVLDYFAAGRQLAKLEDELPEADDDEAAMLADEIERLEERRTAIQATVERAIEGQVRDTLRRQGIYHPAQRAIDWRVGFPPVNVRLDEPLHLFVISPRERIESVREIILDAGLTTAAMETMEAAADGLGVSSLVVELGGLGATLPAFVTNTAGLRFTLEAVAEEWLHQYLAFTPLGFRYLLDITGLRRDYEIATINETVVGIVSEEIAELTYRRYYGGETAPAEDGAGFDFNAEMRRIRLAVDGLLADGEPDEAETYMAAQGDYLAANGYYIRKLNQAYFAFHGTYADEPTSVSPIGQELRTLRARRQSLADFLAAAATIDSHEGLRALIAE